MTVKKYLWLAIALLISACAVVPPPANPPEPGPTPPNVSPDVPPATSWRVDVIACSLVERQDEPCHGPIPGATIQLHGPDGYISQTANAAGYTVFTVPAGFVDSDVIIDAPGYMTARAHIDVADTHDSKHNIITLASAVPPQPLLDKRDFIEHYQGNFGSIKVPGCGFYNDSLFDPVVLLGTWTRDKGCFERAMAAHAVRNDNRVVIDPRVDYHDGQGGALLDLWHDPQTFAAFIRDVRSHRNARGEPFKVFLFLSADNHIPSFLVRGQEGVPDLAAEAHFAADVRALAAVAGDLIDGTSPCWECRHQRDYETPGTYQRNLRVVAAAFPNAWHGIHLISGSSSWSSWNCDPDQIIDGVRASDLPDGRPGRCTEAQAHREGDDPYRGNELAPWVTCVAEGTCDGIAYQFAVGDEYVNPDRYPNYTGQPGALGRFFEIAVRMGRDPWSIASKRGSDPRWPLNGGVDVLAFEFIYDAYNDRSTEAYGLAFCQRALAIGGWGCGSASVRR